MDLTKPFAKFLRWHPYDASYYEQVAVDPQQVVLIEECDPRGELNKGAGVLCGTKLTLENGQAVCVFGTPAGVVQQLEKPTRDFPRPSKTEN